MTPTTSSIPEPVSNGTIEAPFPTRTKKLHGRAFYESIGSPKFILAPMVDQSEFVLSPLQQPPPVDRMHYDGIYILFSSWLIRN